MLTMWSSGQQQPAWGWPPPNMNNNQYEQEFDPSQSWAAAAALWAQQRQLQEQCQNGNGPASSKLEKPPEPPGPPPIRPPLPPMDGPPLQSSVQNIQVHDYMHGKASTQTTEIIDYQHGKISEPLPNAADYNHIKVVDENQQEWEVTSDNWQDHQPVSQEFYNGGWTQDGWNGDQMNYYAAAAQHYQNEYSASSAPEHNEKGTRDRRSTSVSSGSHRTEKHGRDDKQSAFPVPLPKVNVNAKMMEIPPVMDAAEIAKRTKVLPLWLRQGLEKMEREKKKQLEKNKSKEETLPVATDISGYKHVSPKSSPGRENQDNSGSEGEAVKEILTESKSPSIANSHKGEKSGEPASASESEDEEDEEEKFQRMMLKVKTWMTEILLGVTNAEIKDVSKEVYFELKRSAKAKATQLRKSGGLDALRSAVLGVDGDITTSESESEDEIKSSPNILDSKTIDNKSGDEEDSATTEIDREREQRYNRENSPQHDDNQETQASKRVENKPSSESDSPPARGSFREERSKISNRKFREGKQPPPSNSRLPTSNSRSPPSNSLVPPSKPPTRSPPAAYRRTSSENESKSQHIRSNKEDNDRMSDERFKYYKKMILESRKQERRKSSTTGDDDDDDDSEESGGDSESEESDTTDSEEVIRRIKAKRRRKERSESASPPRNKKTKRQRKDSSSDDSDHRKKKKRREPSSSSDKDSERSSSHRKKKSSGKKHKRRTKSHSRSPTRSKRKR